MNGNTRWYGLALLVGGILLGIGLLIHPDETLGEQGTVRGILSHSLLLIGVVPTLLSLREVYERTKGPLGLIGYLLTFAGLAFFIAFFALEIFVIPVLLADPSTASLLEATGPLLGGALGMFLMVAGTLFALGAILFGVAILSGDALPKWSGILLILGSPIAFVPPLPYVVGPISGMALGLAFVIFGLNIWSQPMSKVVARASA